MCKEDLCAFTDHPEAKVYSGTIKESQALWLPPGWLITDLMECSSTSGGIACAGLRISGVHRRSAAALKLFHAEMSVDPKKGEAFKELFQACCMIQMSHCVNEIGVIGVSFEILC